MNPFNRLTELFAEFPGIGPRQAKRFAYFLLGRNESFGRELATLISEVRRGVRTCQSCYRFFQLSAGDMQREQTAAQDEFGPFSSSAASKTICSICSDPNRDHSSLMILARDNDLDTIEKSRTYNGYYFVLGGTLPILESEPETRIRLRELIKRSQERVADGLKEIIISLSLNPEGENTEQYVKKSLQAIAETYHVKISTLGRGLSTGTEIEYSDKETLKNALENRH